MVDEMAEARTFHLFPLLFCLCYEQQELKANML